MKNLFIFFSIYFSLFVLVQFVSEHFEAFSRELWEFLVLPLSVVLVMVRVLYLYDEMIDVVEMMMMVLIEQVDLNSHHFFLFHHMKGIKKRQT